MTPNLIEHLIPQIDRTRARLARRLGHRPATVTIVKRRWSGNQLHRGTVLVLGELVLSPPPRVRVPDRQEARHYAQNPLGRIEVGDLEVSEVSLRYTKNELTFAPLGPTDEVLWRVEQPDAATFWGQLLRPPERDVEGQFSWRVVLKTVSLREDGTR